MRTLLIVFIIMLCLLPSYADEEYIREHGAIMLFIHPVTGEILYANSTALDFYGYEEALLGMSIDEINILGKEAVADEMEKAKLEERNHFLFRHRTKNEGIKDVEVYSYPIMYKGEKVLFSVIFDITDKVALENEVEAHHIAEKKALMWTRNIAIFGSLCLLTLIYYIWRTNRSLKHMVLYDTLTGVYNRRHLFDLYEKSISHHRLPMGFFMIDVNNLKFVNDTYGHIYGDELIIKVSKLLNSIPYEKVVARVSGDEFVLLLLSCDQSCIKETQSILTKHLIEIKGIEFNASVGCLMIDKIMSFEKAFSISESHMYEQKAMNKLADNQRILESLRLDLIRQNPELKKTQDRLLMIIDHLINYLDLSEEVGETLRQACLYQDIGLAVVDQDHYDKHVEKSYNILNTLHGNKQLSTICYYHHERYDGRGIMKGLKGMDIPYSARVLHIANAFVSLSEEDLARACDALKQLEGDEIDPELYGNLSEDQIKDIFNKINEVI